MPESRSSQRKRLDLYDSDEEYFIDYPIKRFRSALEDLPEDLAAISLEDFSSKRSRSIFFEEDPEEIIPLEEISRINLNDSQSKNKPAFQDKAEMAFRDKAECQEQLDLWTKEGNVSAIAEALPEILTVVQQDPFDFEEVLLLGLGEQEDSIIDLILANYPLPRHLLNLLLIKAAERGNLLTIETLLHKIDTSLHQYHQEQNLFIMASALMRALQSRQYHVVKKIYPYIKDNPSIKQAVGYGPFSDFSQLITQIEDLSLYR